jgi:hypothetical protein
MDSPYKGHVNDVGESQSRSHVDTEPSAPSSIPKRARLERMIMGVGAHQNLQLQSEDGTFNRMSEAALMETIQLCAHNVKE